MEDIREWNGSDLYTGIVWIRIVVHTVGMKEQNFHTLPVQGILVKDLLGMGYIPQRSKLNLTIKHNRDHSAPRSKKRFRVPSF